MGICDWCMNFPCGEESDMIIVCSDFEEKPKVMTNADRIRSMTDEELAEWCAGLKTECFLCPVMNCERKVCEKSWLDWLKQEA